MYVYYWRTYEKAVSGGEGKRRTCAKEHVQTFLTFNLRIEDDGGKRKIFGRTVVF